MIYHPLFALQIVLFKQETPPFLRNGGVSCYCCLGISP